MATDGVVQIPPDSSGKKIDTSELTRSDGTVVERQRVVLGDATDPNSFVGVSTAGALQVEAGGQDHLVLILAELKRIAMILEIMADTHIRLDDVI